MMTLNEAIEHAEWCADNSCGECAEEHRQLAEWLRELRNIKSENASLKGAAQGLGELCDRYKAENAKLRDFIELLLSCPRDSGECDECRRLNDLCAVELEAGKLGIEVNA